MTYASRCGNLRVVEIRLGKGGWVAARLDDAVAYLRFRPDSRGRLTLRELFVDANDNAPLTERMLERLDIGAIEAAINSEPFDVEYLGHPSHQAGTPLTGRPEPAEWSNLAVLASYFATTYHKQREDTWVEAAAFAAPLRRREISGGWSEVEDFRLTHGPGPDGLSDEFLTDVRRAYGAAMVRGESPNKAIAEALGHPTSRTVERWVYVARQRGIMPPASAMGQKG